MAEYPPLTNIIGRVGKDPERKLAGDKELVEFTVAVSDGFGEGANTTWWQAAVWNEGLQETVLAEIYKGAAVCVEGPSKITKSGEYTNRNISVFRIGTVKFLSKNKPAQADDGDI